MSVWNASPLLPLEIDMDLNSIIQFVMNLFSNQSTTNLASEPSSTSQQVRVNTILIVRGPLELGVGIFGQGSLTWDSFTFVSLENEKLYIPAGTYRMEWHESEHLGGATVPMLIDVQGRTEILLHWGNAEKCSEGCILCGMIRDGNDIDTTQAACQQLFSKIKEVGIENCQITIS